jgi:hypothetical protein
MPMKRCALLAASFLLVAAAYPAGQNLRAGETAIFMKSGDLLVDRINDISSARFVLETANNGEIPLRDIWMINFVNDKWDFSEERSLLETNDHYVFLKNGSVSSGRIVDFSSDRRVFQFESGEEFPIGQIRRIYFAKTLPRSLADQLKPKPQPNPQPNPQPAPQPLPADFAGEYERLNPKPVITLALGEDGAVRMEVTPVSNLPGLVMSGRWEATGPDQVTLTLASTTRVRQTRVYIFNRQGDLLIATGEVKKVYGDLRLRRR